jgi:uncharacterized protein
MRIKEDYDGAEPSGNSVALLNLLRLAQIFNRPDLRASAARALAAFGSRMGRAGGRAADAGGLRIQHFEAAQIILVGERDAPDTQALLRALHSRFVPHRIVLLVDPRSRARRWPATFPHRGSMDRSAAGQRVRLPRLRLSSCPPRTWRRSPS